jgi:hypothetical protein
MEEAKQPEVILEADHSIMRAVTQAFALLTVGTAFGLLYQAVERGK